MMRLQLFTPAYIVFLLGICGGARAHVNWTTVKCIGADFNNSCLFTDVLLLDGKFHQLLPNGTKIERHRINLAAQDFYRSEGIGEKNFASEQERDAFLRTNKTIFSVNDIAIFFHCYYGHIMHHIYDCWYAPFMAITKFFPADTQVVPVMNTPICEKEPCWHEMMMGSFFGREFFNVKKYDPKVGIIFKQIIIGVQSLGIKGFYPDMQISHTSIDSVHIFRDRVYVTQGLPPPAPLSANKSAIQKACIFSNKRFTKEDNLAIQEMKKVINAQNVTEGLIVENFHFGTSLKQQLEDLSKIAIYITGPGTGLLEHIFLPDGGVVVNVGALAKDCMVPPKTVPYFMEACVAGSTWTY